MKKGFVEVVCVIDRSGSMGLIKDDAIGAFNTFLEEQKTLKIGDASLTLVQFNDISEVVYENLDIQKVSKFNEKNYVPNGCTALLDAVCTTIDKVGGRLAVTQEDRRPEKVIFVILTDGQENASKKFKLEDVKSRIDLQTKTYKWKFLYLGVGLDVFNDALSLGIPTTNTVKYDPTPLGIRSAYYSISCCVSNERSSSCDLKAEN